MGYDADTQVYTFRDSDGAYYESAPGNRYGVLRPTGESSGHSSAPDEASASLISPEKSKHDIGDEESLDGDSDLAEWQLDARRARRARRHAAASKDPFGTRQAIKMLLPFALLVIVFLLAFFKFLSGASTDEKQPQVDCAEGFQAVEVQSGETCWAIAKARGITVDELTGIQGNEDVDCDVLGVGQGICVPN